MNMMKSHKVTSAEDYKIVSSFQSLRKTLLEEKFADRLEKPLAYWAMPNDRRLPLAFLGRTIKDLLDTPFEELSATPGIGQKKISSLVKLLSRATKDHPPAVPFGMNDLADAKRIAEKPAARKIKSSFDPAIVSEALWTQWLETARRHHVGRELLGRLAPTLQALPTVIWQTPLEFYMQYSVSEIRQLKTHGEKRVRVVLEVFHIVHEMLSDVAADRHLAVRLAPKFIEPLEVTVNHWLERAEAPTPDEVRDQLTVPLLDQLRIDTGDTIYQLSCGRLGIGGPAQSVRQQSKQMGVTRARVYQLLEDCARVMEVRWPEGKAPLARLVHKLQTEAPPHTDLKLLLATVELFYPGKRGLLEEEAAEELVHAE
jgi:hypothetical protein